MNRASKITHGGMQSGKNMKSADVAFQAKGDDL